MTEPGEATVEVSETVLETGLDGRSKGIGVSTFDFATVDLGRRFVCDGFNVRPVDRRGLREVVGGVAAVKAVA
jgi:hypothetical protein